MRNQDVLTDRVYEEFGELHSGQNSVFFDPLPNYQIRSHFYAPRKYIFGGYYETFYVNLFVILGMTIISYLALYFEVLEKLMQLADRLSMKKRA